ncbi:MAG TPA: DUF4352 domain-containing protein, partial [Mycobacterium sp.]|nr:DUF4352 domain-containing protein [Mycobacterium sp.]
MTTPPTPAGWYPDPDGSGGQRYWDGSAWTEHRSPAATPSPEPSEPPAAEPPPSEQPTSVVSIPPAPTGGGGAHRRPEPEDEAEPPSQPGDNRKLILQFSVACAALFAVLVVAVIYAVFLHRDNTIQIGAPGSSTQVSTSKSASATSGTKSTKANPPNASGQATDSGITFAVTDVATAPSVKYQDAPVEKTAQGEFLIVRMTVLNSGDTPTTFLGTLQKLKAGGATYSIDDEATFYLDGGLAELNPGDTKDLALAFDVPQGTTAESIELHGDPMGSGVEVS